MACQQTSIVPFLIHTSKGYKSHSDPRIGRVRCNTAGIETTPSAKAHLGDAFAYTPIDTQRDTYTDTLGTMNGIFYVAPHLPKLHYSNLALVYVS